MKRKKNRGLEFFWGAIILLAFFSLPILGTSKGILELRLNQLHQPIFDVLFLGLTQLGDGIVFLPVAILYLFRKTSFSIFIGFTALFNAVFIFIGKRLLFPGVPRPAEFLKGIDFYQIPGVELHHWNSFPSGHTATGFSLAFALAIISSKHPKIQRFLLILAIGVGLSRVYLMQHFFVDVWMGAAVGLVSTLVGREITLLYFSGKKFKKPLFKTKPARIPTLRKRIILQQKLVG